MTTIYEWNDSSDTGFTATTGTAPTNETAGSYGERWKWAATTAVAYGYRSGLSLGDFGVRFIYTLAAFSGGSHSVFQCLISGPSAYGRVDLSVTGKLRIRNAANTQLSEGTYTHVVGTEYRFEIYRSGSTLTVKTYNMAGTLLDTITGSIGSSTIERMYFGNNAGLTGTLGIFTIDEILIKDVGSEVGAPSGGAPTASAGADVTSIVAKATTALDGSGSTGTTWAWTLVDYTGDNPGTVTITNANTKNASYTAPTTMTGNVLHFRITVNGTVTDDVYHTVLPHKEWWRDGATWRPLYGTPVVVTPPSGSGGVPAAPAGWNGLLWADYFEGSSLDTSKWWARDHKSQSPTNQQAVYLASQVKVEDGLLKLCTDRQDLTDGGTAYKWKSAGIQSDGLMQLPANEEWIIQCRQRTNMVPGKSRGFWPAFWLRNAPSVGEIDIMEAWGTPADNGGLADTSVVTLWQNTNGGSTGKIGKVVSSDWSEWELWELHGNPVTGTYKFYRDGTLVQSKSASDAAWLLGTEYSSSFYVRLEVQVGKAGTYYGPADDNLVNTNAHYEYQVDYVRAYRRNA